MPLQGRTFQAVKGIDGKVTYVGKNAPFPPNGGFLSKPETKYLYKGEILDRFGITSPKSNYLSPVGTSIESRSLPPNTNLNIYQKYQVVKPLPVQSILVAPYYGLPGMGTQYVTPLPINTLLYHGIIIRLP